jgi:agmatine/peptidylarginine deiminase
LSIIGMQRLPAEWEPQAAVLLTWPHPATDWAPQLEAVEAVYLRIAAAVTARQRLLVVCNDPSHRAHVHERLAAAGIPLAAVALAIAASNDSWTRDHGPLTVLDSAGWARSVDFRFNGWGGKFPADLDDRITARLHAGGWLADTELAASALVLEGGAIDTDGAGSVLAVRRTVLDPARNPGWDQAAVEHELARMLGIRRCLWLEQGQLDGDDTDGHVDTLARFCAPDLICHVTAHPAASEAERTALAGLQRELAALRRADGRPYALVPLPAAAPLRETDGSPLAASYANFLVINGAVLLPGYGDPADAVAAARLASCFPGRDVETIDCRALIRQGGSLHCVTMQLPAVGACR